MGHHPSRARACIQGVAPPPHDLRFSGIGFAFIRFSTYVAARYAIAAANVEIVEAARSFDGEPIRVLEEVLYRKSKRRPVSQSVNKYQSVRIPQCVNSGC